MKFQLNGIGEYLIRKQKRSVLKYVWNGLLLLIIFILATRFLMKDRLYQPLMYFWSIIIPIAISIGGPVYINWLLKKVITEIEFTENGLKLETSKDIKSFKNLSIKRCQNHFKGFGNKHVSGYIIQNSNGSKEYWLIET